MARGLWVRALEALLMVRVELGPPTPCRYCHPMRGFNSSSLGHAGFNLSAAMSSWLTAPGHPSNLVWPGVDGGWRVVSVSSSVVGWQLPEENCPVGKMGGYL